MRLRAAAVRTLQRAPGKSEQVIFDETLPGFGLRVRAAGAQTWLVQYAVAGRTRRVLLGSPALVDASKARSMAKDLLASVRLGGDPAGEKVAARAEAANTVRALLPRFLHRQRARLKPRSLEETTRHLEQHARPLHGHPIQAVNRRMIAMLRGDIAERSGPAASNSVRSSISAFLSDGAPCFDSRVHALGYYTGRRSRNCHSLRRRAHTRRSLNPDQLARSSSSVIAERRSSPGASDMRISIGQLRRAGCGDLIKMMPVFL
jgi:hypothetical protein